VTDAGRRLSFLYDRLAAHHGVAPGGMDDAICEVERAAVENAVIGWKMLIGVPAPPMSAAAFEKAI